jgi:two-component system, chemotaxis family, protein-glutamate methylesterase/glutaminase
MEKMNAVTHPIIVVGASAGGWDSLPVLLENLPDNLPASIFIVQHLSGETLGTGFLNHLSQRSVLPCGFAVDNEPIHRGRVYLAPPDHHMLLVPGHIRTSKGPRENGFRPSVDTLFRSAANHYSNQVIGIILSGMGDDGTEGLATIARTGGVTVVQDPNDASYPGMPQAALKQMEVDYKVIAVDLGLVITNLVYHPPKPAVDVPKDVADEANIAEKVLTSLDHVEDVGTASGFSCPSCGGVLWDVDHRNGVHSFRCHAGHAFSFETLFQLKSREVEEALWAGLRLMEEQKRMLSRFPLTSIASNSISKRLVENQRYIDQLRSILLTDTTNPAPPSP